MWTFQTGLLFSGNGSVILMGACFVFEFLFFSIRWITVWSEGGDKWETLSYRSSDIQNSPYQVPILFSNYLSPCLFLVAKSCLTLCSRMDRSPSDSSVLGILQARILEWIAMPSFRGSSWLRDGIHVSCTGGQILYRLSHREANLSPGHSFKNSTWSNYLLFTSMLTLFPLPEMSSHSFLTDQIRSLFFF